MTPGRLFWLLRRDYQRGIAAAWHDHRTVNRLIGRLPKPHPPADPATEIHVLLGPDSWRLTVWMLASWELQTGHTWPVFLWEDGQLDEASLTRLIASRPHDTLIRKSEATRRFEPALVAHPACLAYRRAHPLAQKIFDFCLHAADRPFLLLDSDVLFFRRPGEILAWCANDRRSCRFNADVAEGALISSEGSLAALGLAPLPRLNSGLCLVPPGFLDLDLCERALTQTSLLKGHPWRVEQTLFALCAARHGDGGLLPSTYEVSLGKSRARDAVARHYVGAVRDRFYAEGVRELAKILLP